MSFSSSGLIFAGVYTGFYHFLVGAFSSDPTHFIGADQISGNIIRGWAFATFFAYILQSYVVAFFVLLIIESINYTAELQKEKPDDWKKSFMQVYFSFLAHSSIPEEN